jgi:hypothetical protein
MSKKIGGCVISFDSLLLTMTVAMAREKLIRIE